MKVLLRVGYKLAAVLLTGLLVLSSPSTILSFSSLGEVSVQWILSHFMGGALATTLQILLAVLQHGDAIQHILKWLSSLLVFAA